jgi:GT2 family glycosyltransferase
MASDQDSMTTTIIIVNYNAGPFLRECLESLAECPADKEIIVVDNASTDNSLSFLDDVANVRVLRNERNKGFAAACNQGLSIAGGETVLFLNPDCSLDGEVIPRLLKALHSKKNVGMVGGLLVNPDGTEQGGGRRAIPTPWRSFVRAFGLSRFAHRWPKLFFDFHLHRQPLPSRPIEVEAISGACMMVKRSAIESVGLWDEDYFLHCEDLDWCMRFRQAGWSILFVPTARVTHALGACSRTRPWFVEWHKHKGMLHFYCKFFRHQYPGVLMWLVTVGVWIRFIAVCLHHFVSRTADRFKHARS